MRSDEWGGDGLIGVGPLAGPQFLMMLTPDLSRAFSARLRPGLLKVPPLSGLTTAHLRTSLGTGRRPLNTYRAPALGQCRLKD